jgi:endo-1,4-beta-xylanase
MQGWQPFDNPTLTPTMAVAHTGFFSLEVSNRTASFNGPSYDLTGRVLNLQRITATAFVYYAEGNSTETFRITSLKRQAGAADVFTNIAIVNVPAGQWTELTGNYTLDFQGTLQDLLIYIECDNPALTFFVDDISITSPGAPNLQRNIPAVDKVYKKAFLIGSAVQLSAISGNLLTDLLKMHFNSITPENDFKPENLEPEEGVFTFDQADQYVNFAQANDFYIRGHTLVWHQQEPDWIFVDANGQPVSRDVLLARMQTYIQTVVGRYKGKVNAWDVVNEAIDTSAPNNLRVSPWLEIIGPDYIDKAFIFARETDPNARLFYNDFNTYEPAKRQAIFNLVKGLKQRGVPIDGIGMQTHINIFAPAVDDIKTTIKTFAKLGVEIQITELDMSIYHNTSESSFECPPQDRLIRQGLPTYGECGGFIYLTKGVRSSLNAPLGEFVGVFPVEPTMLPPRKGRGSREVELRRETVLGPPGTVIRGHEFHYSDIEEMPQRIPRAYELRKPGVDLGKEGYVVKNCLGSYVHLHFGSNPSVPCAFVDACERWRRGKEKK